ncbi:MAG: hypothetical protein C1943_17265 [Halochromatium sp.]|nr:hypothetical protein [Halochromatium sp.]
MELVAGPMLTLTKIGSGSGAVTSDPLGINCGVDCLQGFALGESITLTAQPEEDSRFVGWGGACSGTAQTCQLTITTEVQVNAEFDTEASDADGDEIPDGEDNCPADPNPDQADLDGDQQGDVCDADDDGDGVDDDQDAFPRDPGERADTDGDGIGDNGDNCPSLANPDQADSNSDGIGDACDDLGECAPEALHVQDRIFSRARLHLRSAQSITTSGDVVIPLGAEVIFEAPRHTLGPGFRVAVGARLTVSARAVQCAAASAGDAD